MTLEYNSMLAFDEPKPEPDMLSVLDIINRISHRMKVRPIFNKEGTILAIKQALIKYGNYSDRQAEEYILAIQQKGDLFHDIEDALTETPGKTLMQTICYIKQSLSQNIESTPF
jgi:hypothetical protein